MYVYRSEISCDYCNCWACDKRSESVSHSFVFPRICCTHYASSHLTHESCTRPCPRLGLPRNTARHLPTLADQLFAPSSSLADSRNSHDTLGRARAVAVRANITYLDLSRWWVTRELRNFRSFDRWIESEKRLETFEPETESVLRIPVKYRYF